MLAHVLTGIAVLDLHGLAPLEESSLSQFPRIGMAFAKMLTVSLCNANLPGGRHPRGSTYF